MARLLVLVLVLLLDVPARADEYRDPEHGWSVTLPAGWRLVSPGAQAPRGIRLWGEGAPEETVAAFGIGAPASPTVLVSVRRAPNMSLEELRAAVGASAIDAGSPRVVSIRRSPEPPINVRSAFYPGRDVVVCFHEAGGAGGSAFLDAMSFRFDPGLGYAPVSARTRVTRAACAIGLGVALLVGLVASWIVWRRRAPTPAPSPG